MTAFREEWYVDQYLLTEGSVRDWEMRSGTGKTGGMVGQNTTMPYRRGESWVRKNLGPGSFVLNLWLEGVDAADAQEQYNTILRQAVRPERLVEWKRIPNDGSEARTCMGEVVAAVEPTFVGQRTYRMGIEVHVPAGKWQGSASHTLASTTGADLPKNLVLTAPLGDSTAPLDDLTYKITGPVNSGWVLRDLNGPDTLTGNEAIPAGAVLTINADSWDMTATGFTPNLAAYVIKGPRLMTISTRTESVTPTVQLDAAGGGATTKLEITGTASWLV